MLPTRNYLHTELYIEEPQKGVYLINEVGTIHLCSPKRQVTTTLLQPGKSRAAQFLEGGWHENPKNCLEFY